VTTGIVVFAHGSRVEPANEAVRTVAAAFARAGGYPHVETAFLELGTPSLEDAIKSLAGKGLQSIVVIPYFLTLGLHLERDLPRLIADISNKNSGLQISVTPPLDGHPGLVEILKSRAADAIVEHLTLNS
jgi:sirohydrochlorin ferrochelatase